VTATVAEPLTSWIEEHIARVDARPALLGLSGPQGAGKSTAAAMARKALGGRVCVICIDDVYLTRAERRVLAKRVHPLFETRGPPGTHDLGLLGSLIDALSDAAPGAATPLPRFDRLSDDRFPRDDWSAFEGRPDAILIDAWCAGATPDPGAPSAPPLNAVEEEDEAGAWRACQEDALAGPYAALWDRIDAFFHIQAPGFDCVRDWRTEQEATTRGVAVDSLTEAQRAWVARFIMHYERITRRMLDGARRPGRTVRIGRRRELRD